MKKKNQIEQIREIKNYLDIARLTIVWVMSIGSILLAMKMDRLKSAEAAARAAEASMRRRQPK